MHHESMTCDVCLLNSINIILVSTTIIIDSDSCYPHFAYFQIHQLLKLSSTLSCIQRIGLAPDTWSYQVLLNHQSLLVLSHYLDQIYPHRLVSFHHLRLKSICSKCSSIFFGFQVLVSGSVNPKYSGPSACPSIRYDLRYLSVKRSVWFVSTRE